MIPNAVASTGPYAGLWSFLKSIDHALERTLSSGGDVKLTELDRDRLGALADFLRGSVEAGSPQIDLLSVQSSDEPNYSEAIDLKQKISTIAEFDDWQRKKGFEFKLSKLITSLDAFLSQQAGANLFSANIPQEEFVILKRIVETLLNDAETALYD